MSAYVKCYDGQSKWMHFLVEGYVLLEKYNVICDKVSADVKKEFDKETVYKKFFFLKTKIKSYSDEVTDFYDKEIPNVDSNLTYLAVNLDSALNKGGNYHR